MNSPTMFFVSSLFFVTCNIVISIPVMHELDKKDIKTNFLLIRLLIIKYVNRYREVTIIALSTIFALLLFPSIVGRHGVAKSLFFTMLGAAVIWGIFFLWVWVINSIVEDEIRNRMAGRKHHQKD